jgi:hypothetical protein
MVRHTGTPIHTSMPWLPLTIHLFIHSFIHPSHPVSAESQKDHHPDHISCSLGWLAQIYISIYISRPSVRSSFLVGIITRKT